MNKDTALALAIIAYGFATVAAEWPAPPPGMAYETDLKPHSLVVTNVVLDGVPTTADLDGKRDKTDNIVEETQFTEWKLSCQLDLIQDALDKADILATWDEYSGEGWWYFSLPSEILDHSGEPYTAYGSMVPGGRDATFLKSAGYMKYGTSEMFPVIATREMVAKKGESYISIVGVTNITSRLATTSTVAKIARQVVNTVWDSELGVAWEARMHNGQLYYVAVTNQPPEVVR